MIARQAELVARWLLVGFIHGVMNTDNTSISGETIDYGPCAFMDAYDPATVFSSIDEQGRYAYANQPRIALWNLTRLAECLLPLFSDDRTRRSNRRRRPRRISRNVYAPPISPACAGRSACSPRATATRHWCRTFWMSWPKITPTSP